MLVGKLEKEMDIYDLSVKFKKGEENLFVSMVDYIIFLIEKQNSMTEIPNAIKFLHDYVKEKKIILPTRYVSNTFFLNNKKRTYIKVNKQIKRERWKKVCMCICIYI